MLFRSYCSSNRTEELRGEEKTVVGLPTHYLNWNRNQTEQNKLVIISKAVVLSNDVDDNTPKTKAVFCDNTNHIPVVRICHQQQQQ